MNSMIKVPNNPATPMSANAIDKSRTQVAVARLNKTKTSINFQNMACVGTRPTKPYTIPP